MAEALRATSTEFAVLPARVAEVAFLYGREYGKWEAGAIEQIEVPAPARLKAEIAANPDLTRQLDELCEGVAESLEQVAQVVRESEGQSDASQLLSQWEGFGRFCRETLGVAPLTLVRAAAEVVAAYADGAPVEAELTRWAERWTKSWKRRFAVQP
jgi:hypothetical protein